MTTKTEVTIGIQDLIDRLVPGIRWKRTQSNGVWELHAPCPLPGCSSQRDAFYIIPSANTWSCRKCNDRRSDRIEFVKRLFGYDFQQARDELVRLGFAKPPVGSTSTVDPIQDYPAQHGCTWDDFKRWGAEIRVFHDLNDGKNYDSIFFPDSAGGKYRLFGHEYKFKPAQSKQPPCWYGLKEAVKLALDTNQPLVLVNGQPSVIACHAHGVAACTIPGGETKIPGYIKKLVGDLLVTYHPSNPIIVLLDGDHAGRTQGPKAADVLRQFGYSDVRVKDPGNGMDAANVVTLNNGTSVAAIQALPDVGQPATAAAVPASGGTGTPPPPQAPASPGPAAAAGGNPKPKPSDAIRQDLYDLGYEFWLNEGNDKVEVRIYDPANRQAGPTYDGLMTDLIRARIRVEMRDQGYRHVKAVEDVCDMIAAENPCHPIRDYLNGCTWDGQDHIRTLADKLVPSSNKKIIYPDGSGELEHYVYLKRWLVGAVAKVFDQKQNMMLVLGGPTGVGKSTLARWLCSGIPRHYMEGPINTDDKDSDVRLMSKFIWEVAEVDATTRRADAAALKSFITRQVVTVRKSHGREDTEKPALTSFIGTFNPSSGFLVDSTGNRRFMIATIERIDWSYQQIPIDQVWAQAVALYRQGESPALLPCEARHQTEENKAHEIASALDDYLGMYFIATGDPNDRLKVAEIIDHLRSYSVPLNGTLIGLSRDLTMPLQRFGASYVRTSTTRYWTKIARKP